MRWGWGWLLIILAGWIVAAPPPAQAQISCGYDFVIRSADKITLNGVNIPVTAAKQPINLDVGDVLRLERSTAGALTNPLWNPVLGLYTANGVFFTATVTELSNIWYVIASYDNNDVYDPHTVDAPYNWIALPWNTRAPHGATITIVSVGEDETPCEEEIELVRPLRATDEIGWTVNTASSLQVGPLSKFGFTREAGSPVHAAADGTIIEMRPISGSDCFALIGSFTPACNFDLFSMMAGLPIPVPAFPLVQIGLRPMWGDAYMADLVVLDTGDLRISYIVANAELYVQQGMTVGAGCIVGETAEIATTIPGIQSELPGVVVALTSDRAIPVPLMISSELEAELPDYWTIQPPTEGNPCLRASYLDGCLGDAQLRDPSAWQLGGSSAWTSGGVSLADGDSIMGLFALDRSRAPELIVTARGAGVMEMSLGATSQRVDVGATVVRHTILGAPHVADVGGLYSVRVGNYLDTQAPVIVTEICVRHTYDGLPPGVPPTLTPDGWTPTPRPTTTPPPPPDQIACTVRNSSFNTVLANRSIVDWAGSPGVEAGEGDVLMPSGATVSQTIGIPAGTYTLTVVAAPWGAIVDDDGVMLDLEYDTGAGYSPLGSYSLAAYSDAGGTISYRSTLVLASPASSFVLRATIVGSSLGLRGMRIKSICLNDGDAPPPVVGGGSGGGPGGGPFVAVCGDIIPTPRLGDSVQTWIGWMWGQLSYFFRCELMVILNSIIDTITRFFTTMAQVSRWMMASMDAAMQWFGGDLIGWLGGHLANIASGQSTTIVSASGGCDIWCILETLVDGLVSALDGIIDIAADIVDFLIDLVTAVINAAFAIMAAILALFLWLVGEVYRIFMMATGLLMSIINAWGTATPEAINGLNCAVDWDQSAVCLSFWILDNTVLSGPGEFMIPSITTLASVILAMWIFKRFRYVIIQMGAST